MNLDGLAYAVQPMRLTDIAVVSALEREVFSLPWSTSAFRYELEYHTASEYLVLRYMLWAESRIGLLDSARRLFRPHRADSSLIGYGGYWMAFDEAHVATIAVCQAWRGRGLGEMLLLALMERALKRQAHFVTLEVRVSNVVAQNLYLKCGFEIVGRRKRYYSDNGEDAFIMTVESVASPEFQARFRQLQSQLRDRLMAQSQLAPDDAGNVRERR